MTGSAVFDTAALHQAGGLAAYTWGSLALDTAAVAPIDGDTVLRMLVAASQGVFPADSPRDQSGALALVHELTHLQQDAATGLGAWDHLMTREAYFRLAVQTRWLVTSVDRPPYAPAASRALHSLSGPFAEQVCSDLVAVRERTVGARQLSGAEWATPPVRRWLEQRLGQPLRDDDVAELSLRGLLEAEAAFLTWQVVLATRHSPDALDWLDDHEAQWSFVAMSAEYSAVLALVVQALGATVDDVRDRSDDYLRWIGRLLCWAVDVACAYPSPDELASTPVDIRAFDPVVRFSEVIRVLVRLQGGAVSELIAALGEDRPEEAEHVMLGVCDLPYPHTRTTYERWLDVLDGLAASEQPDAWLWRIRRDAVAARLDTGHAKGLLALTDASMPVQAMVVGQGMRGVMQGEYLLAVDEVRRALVDRRLDLELYALLHGRGVFRCPYAGAGPCPNARRTCTALRDLADLPGEQDCYVRRSLARAGWSLPTPRDRA